MEASGGAGVGAENEASRRVAIGDDGAEVGANEGRSSADTDELDEDEYVGDEAPPPTWYGLFEAMVDDDDDEPSGEVMEMDSFESIAAAVFDGSKIGDASCCGCCFDGAGVDKTMGCTGFWY